MRDYGRIITVGTTEQCSIWLQVSIVDMVKMGEKTDISKVAMVLESYSFQGY